jgi:hypothetical protein
LICCLSIGQTMPMPMISRRHIWLLRLRTWTPISCRAGYERFEEACRRRSKAASGKTRRMFR